MTSLVVLFLIVLSINLLPAFGPPTWSIILFYGLNSALPAPLIVVVSALAAASGRLLLANGFRYLRAYLPEKVRHNLVAANALLGRRKRSLAVGLGLFALSPLPSAQLFEAAGLAGVRLLSFTMAFFFGRLVSYSIYAASAKGIRGTSLGDAVVNIFSSPWGIALQIGMIALLVLLARINWSKFGSKDNDQQASDQKF
ncbi:MAG: hypothetical protein P0Y64_18145 [Candidatus Sphingomonas colombiensis]|nr:hypothetical protein [Sphingomonas sp.]WEK43218.1 MAG: hypothetical protein P0Y64_18145 [Sphingomonas sp.]